MASAGTSRTSDVQDGSRTAPVVDDALHHLGRVRKRRDGHGAHDLADALSPDRESLSLEGEHDEGDSRGFGVTVCHGPLTRFGYRRPG